MKIGITGATGFIGQYLVRDYHEYYDFMAPVRKIPVKEYVGVDYIQSDFSVDDLQKIFKDCDAVIHLAAKGMPKNRNPLKMEDYLSNIELSAHVIEVCKLLDIKNVVCMSSKAIWASYENRVGMVLDEDLAPFPADEYGVSKHCVEDLVYFYNSVYDMNIKVLRPAEVCGLDLLKGMVNPFWKAVLGACIEGKPIQIYGKGEAKRELIYVKDVVEATMCAVRSADMKGFYNVCTGGLISNLEIARAFCDEFCNEAGIQILQDKEEWGTKTSMRLGKLSMQLGYIPKYNLNSIVKDIKQEYLLFRSLKR